MMLQKLEPSKPCEAGSLLQKITAGVLGDLTRSQSDRIQAEYLAYVQNASMLSESVLVAAHPTNVIFNYLKSGKLRNGKSNKFSRSAKPSGM